MRRRSAFAFGGSNRRRVCKPECAIRAKLAVLVAVAGRGDDHVLDWRAEEVPDPFSLPPGERASARRYADHSAGGKSNSVASASA